MNINTCIRTLLLAGLFSSASSFGWSGKVSQVGDMIYKATGWDSAYVGHTGVLYTPGADRRIADVAGGSDRTKYHHLSVVRTVGSFENDGYEGARRFNDQREHGLSYSQKTALLARINYFNSSNVMYDDNHLDQKGTWFSHDWWWEDQSHWEFDCVGFVERIMEDIGLNPTYGGYESGWGWPLTVGEQRDSDHLTSAPSKLYRTVKSCATGAALAPQQQVSLIDGTYTNYTCASRYQAQCIDDGTFDSYYDEVCGD